MIPLPILYFKAPRLWNFCDQGHIDSISKYLHNPYTYYFPKHSCRRKLTDKLIIQFHCIDEWKIHWHGHAQNKSLSHSLNTKISGFIQTRTYLFRHHARQYISQLIWLIRSLIFSITRRSVIPSRISSLACLRFHGGYDPRRLRYTLFCLNCETWNFCEILNKSQKL